MPSTRTTDALHHLVLDILETDYGSWHTRESIVDRALAIRPGVRPDSVRRAIERLVAAGDTNIETRHHHFDGFTPKRQIRARTRSYLEATA